MLIETSSNSCNCLRDSFAEFLDILHEELPSHFIATKHHCMLDCREIELSPKCQFLLPKIGKSILIQKNSDTADHERKKAKLKTKCFAKMAGNYYQVHKIMTDKIKRSCNSNINLNKIIMFDSFDGANHLEAVKGKIDLVSFSTAIDMRVYSKK